MKIDLKNKIVVITGSTKGLGRYLAKSFAQSGATIIINSRHNPEILKTVAEFKSKKYNCYGAKFDVSKKSEVKKKIKEIINKFDHIDVLINNAAVSYLAKAENISEKLWDDTMEINLKGVFNLCQSVFKIMKNQGGGKIINIGSDSTKLGTLMADLSYVASKAGIVGLTSQLANEWSKYNININNISVPLLNDKQKIINEDYKKAIDRAISMTPLKRLAEFEDIANLAIFLSSDKSNFITGQTIRINGGLAFN